jgi:uncharacterized protein YrrD
MDKTILFQLNADVIVAHEKQVGSLERVVMNPETKVITDIVVKTGSLLDKVSKVVPIELVHETNENQIKLSDTVDNWEDFPPLEDLHLVDGNGDTGEIVDDVPPVIYANPILGPSRMPMSPDEQPVTQVERNVPADTVALNEDTKIITTDGKHVGNLESVLANSSVDQVTHIGISMGTLMKKEKLIPIKWIKEINVDEVTLRVNKESIEELADTLITP